MSTYRELVYLISDLAKSISDDTMINEMHIAFLVNKYRTYLFRQKYDKNANTKIPQSAYQTICVKLQETSFKQECSDNCLLRNSEDLYLKSVKEIPTIFYPCIVKIVAKNVFNSKITMIGTDRMGYVGHNKWLKNTIYATVDTDNHLYLKSSNSSLYEKKGDENLVVDRVYLTAVFDNPEEAYNMASCGDDGCQVICDFLDAEFPFEGALETQLISLVLNELVGAEFRPSDKVNNAKDDLSDLAAYVNQNMKRNS